MKEAFVNEWNIIVVNMRSAGEDILSTEITGASEEKLDIQIQIEYDTDHNQAIIKYFPTEVGKHNIGIFWSDSHIKNSPCEILVKEKCKHDGLEGKNIVMCNLF